VNVNPSPTLSTSGSTILCAGQSATLQSSGADTYSWSSGPVNSSITVTPLVTTTYSVTGTSTVNGCSSIAALGVTIVPIPTVSISGPTAVCIGQTVALTGNGASTYSWSNGSTLTTIASSPTVPTTYSVIGTSGPGCSGTVAISMVVNPNPTVAMSASPGGSVCAGSNVIITTTVNGANTYSWSNGSTTNSITVSPGASTVYSVQVINSVTGCSASAAYSVMVDPCTGIASIVYPKNLKIYPNPFKGKFDVELENGMNVTFEIIDVSGRLILNGKLNEGKNTIDMNTQAKGIYYLKFSGDHQSVYKIISD
jgi:hypothetical protein